MGMGTHSGVSSLTTAANHSAAMANEHDTSLDFALGPHMTGGNRGRNGTHTVDDIPRTYHGAGVGYGGPGLGVVSHDSSSNSTTTTTYDAAATAAAGHESTSYHQFLLQQVAHYRPQQQSQQQQQQPIRYSMMDVEQSAGANTTGTVSSMGINADRWRL
jgi:hypothetical protein